MGTKGSNIFFQDEEDYLDDPISLLDFEERAIFCGSDFFLRNITIEDPGYVVNTSLEKYEVPLKQSLLQLKELKKPRESSVCANNTANLLSKCRSCSINVVDCHKFPWYYRNKLGYTNKTQYLKIEHNVIEIKKEKDEKEMMIVDLSAKDIVKSNKIYVNRMLDVNKEKIGKVKANRKEFTSFDNSVGANVTKQSDKTLSKLVNNQNKNHTTVPRCEAVQAPDLITRTYTTILDKTIQKSKSNIESSPNIKKISHNLGNRLLIGSKTFIKNHDNYKQNITNLEAPELKVKKVSKTNKKKFCYNNNEYKNVHNKNKNGKKSNKIEYVYTSEQISKTKIKIKKGSLKSKEIISNINTNKEYAEKGYNVNLNATNVKHCDYSKTLVKNNNSFASETQQNHYENKQKRIESNSPLQPCPDVPKTIIKTKKTTSLPNQNICPDYLTDQCYCCNGGNKQLFSTDRIIPHFHNSIFLNQPDILSKTNTKECLKRSKDTIHNYESKRLKKSFVSTDSLDMGSMLDHIPNPTIHPRIHDYCIGNNNAMANIKEDHKNDMNNAEDISNIWAVHSVNPDQLRLSINNEMILKSSTQAAPDVIMENTDDIFFMGQSKRFAALIEEERPRYLLPSNCNLPDTHIKKIYFHIMDESI